MKKFWRIILVFCLIGTMICGCGQKEESYSKENYEEELTIDVFDTLANYQGIQTGWFAKEIEDRFNMKLNIIAPNVSYNGDVLQDVRAASGSIGDIVIVSAESGALEQMAENGLLLDMTEYIEDKDIYEKYKSQIDNLNEGLGGIYAIPSEISTSANEVSNILEPTYAPYIRWDLYKELGYPKISTLEDLLPILKQMQELCPKSDSGKDVYAFSFFSDWDDNLMNAAKQPCCFYGYDECGFALRSADGEDYIDILDEDSLYMRVLEFYFEANSMGLVDPKSRTQSYADVFAKYQDGAVLFSPWPYQGQSAYNTTENLESGKAFMAADIEDMSIYVEGSKINGNTKTVIAVGNSCKDPDRMVDFIDFLYSDEGIYLNQASSSGAAAGIQGIMWDIKGSEIALTDLGQKIFVDKEDTILPGYKDMGTYLDGISQLNFTAVSLKEKDTNGNTYTYLLWDSEKNKEKSEIEEDWSEKNGGATCTLDMLDAEGKIALANATDNTSAVEDSEIKEIRSACKKIIVEYSWDMVFAGSKEEFDSLKAEMISICKSLGYDKVYEYDITKYNE